MSLERPVNRKELIEHTKIRMGYPVVRINMDDKQFELVLEEVLDLYCEYAADGKEKGYIVFALTATDIANGYVLMPRGTMFINGLRTVPTGGLPAGFGSGSNSMFWLTHGSSFGGFLNGSFIPISNNTKGNESTYQAGLVAAEYAILRQYVDTLDYLFDRSDSIVFDYNTATRKLVSPNFVNAVEGTPYAAIVWMRVDVIYEGQDSDFWNDYIFRELYLWKCYLQWGRNLSKFDNIQLPSGHTINSSGMIDMANTEIEKLMEKLEDAYARSGGDIIF